MTSGRIVTYVTKEPKKARRGQPAINAGTQLFLIKYANGKYFYCGYTDRKAAETVMSRLSGTTREIDFNSVDNPERTMHYVGSLLR